MGLIPSTLETERMLLVASTAPLARAEIAGAEAFAAALSEHLGQHVSAPCGWPPPLNDQESMAWSLDFLEQTGWEGIGWGLWYMLLRPEKGEDEGLLAIGNGGFKGQPDDERTVEIGYSVVPDYQRQGLAPEAVAAWIEWAAKYGAVRRVIAHTLTDLTPSIRVMEKCGFEGPHDGPEDGVIRYDLLLKG